MMPLIMRYFPDLTSMTPIPLNRIWHARLFVPLQRVAMPKQEMSLNQWSRISYLEAQSMRNTILTSPKMIFTLYVNLVSLPYVLFSKRRLTLSPEQCSSKKTPEKPLIETISWQVENINWLLEILLDRHMAEDFVDLWAHQKELLQMHQKASPMVRYELSRVSAVIFVAMGTRKLQCQAESRYRVLNSWFGSMLLDFGWLQRCRKGLNVRELEEAMGQALLTLPLKQQYGLFMEWFRCFSKHGTECPNLSKAFQIWWRRSFLRGSETHTIESR